MQVLKIPKSVKKTINKIITFNEEWLIIFLFKIIILLITITVNPKEMYCCVFSYLNITGFVLLSWSSTVTCSKKQREQERWSELRLYIIIIYCGYQVWHWNIQHNLCSTYVCIEDWLSQLSDHSTGG